MVVREFNAEGIKVFRAYLAACREIPARPLPREILEDERLTVVVEPRVDIGARALPKKADAAHYLAQVLAPLEEGQVLTNAGLWTWLTLFFFDEVCPPQVGKRIVRNDYHYVFEPMNARHFYRHLLFISWQVRRIAGEYTRLFLGSPLSTLDTVTTEVMKRLFLTRIPCIFEVLDRLYWDERRGRARPGIVGSRQIKPGDLTHRLPVRIHQLEKTYDLISLNADQLIELLGDEFRFTSADGHAPRQARLPFNRNTRSAPHEGIGQADR